MINHDLRCIFVHIPRTGGSSIERWLCGKNWWAIDPASKHMTARQMRDLYAPYWDDYYKFSVVRHPMTRLGSMLHYAQFFGLSVGPDGAVDFTRYHARFGAPVTVEFDHRFYNGQRLRHADHLPGQIYGNTLDCPLDFIAQFETLAADMETVRARLGVANPMAVHIEKSKKPVPQEVLAASRSAVQQIYALDFEAFGYAPDL